MRARLFPRLRLVRLPLLLTLSFCTLAFCTLAASTPIGQQIEITKSKVRYPTLEAARKRFAEGNMTATYLRLLEGYRAYDDEQAKELGELWERLYPDPLVLDMLLTAVPIELAPLSEMALTDLALAAFQRDAKDEAERHLRMAERFVDLNLRPPVLQRDSPVFQRHTRFARDWYLAIIWLRFARLNYDDLYVILDRARLKFGDDPEILLSSGTEEEITLMRERLTRHDGRGVGPSSIIANFTGNTRVARATDYFRRAIALDPNAAEARIRLARLIASLNDRSRDDGALTLLREARDITKTPPLLYLAALFAGDIEEQRKNQAAASLWYRTAIAACPRAQTARLAQSHVQLDLEAGLHGASNTLRPLPSVRPNTDGLCEPDPWRLYAFGQAWRLPAHIARMRKEAREMTPAASEP